MKEHQHLPTGGKGFLGNIFKAGKRARSEKEHGIFKELKQVQYCKDTVSKGDCSRTQFWKDRLAYAVEDFINHIKEMGLHYRTNEKPLKGIKQESDEITFSFLITLAAM